MDFSTAFKQYWPFLLLALWFVLGFALAIVESTIHPPDMSGAIKPLVPAHLAPFVTLPALWLLSALFYGWFWRHGGQTLGMKTWQLRLVTSDDRPLGSKDVLVRAAVGTLSLLAGGLGFFWVIVNGRTWHDMASRTRVVVIPKGE